MCCRPLLRAAVKACVHRVPPPFCCTSLISGRRKPYFGLSVSSVLPRRHYSSSPRFPPAAMQPPDKKTKISANQEERRQSLTLTPSCLQHSPASFLLFFPAYCSFPQLIFLGGLKSLQETADLIKFTLLIFVCISCFVLLDVLIRPFWVEVLFCKTVSFAKKRK